MTSSILFFFFTKKFEVFQYCNHNVVLLLPVNVSLLASFHIFLINLLKHFSGVFRYSLFLLKDPFIAQVIIDSPIGTFGIYMTYIFLLGCSG